MSDTKDLATNLARLLRLAEARGLPEISTPSGEPPALSVADEPFASIIDAVTLALACPNDQKVLLMDISPDVYFETEQQVGQDLVLLRLDRISDEELSLRLHDAWEFVAPDHLRRLVD
jgi:hypothetical protein